MATYEYTFGDQSGLPPTVYLAGLDLHEMWRRAQSGQSPSQYTSMSVIDAPKPYKAVLRFGGHILGNMSEAQNAVATAIEHWGVIHEAGLQVPDLRYILRDRQQGNEYEPDFELLTVVRHLGGTSLLDTPKHRQAHHAPYITGMSEYYRWIIDTKRREFLYDLWQTANCTVTRPDDPESPVYIHDVDPWLEHTTVGKLRLRNPLFTGNLIYNQEHARRFGLTSKASTAVYHRGVPLWQRAVYGLMARMTERTEYEQ
ncbi:MAG TPA: hypothetical protein VLF91_04270 [Candidatus Saccharimonadales bacterium]|nr:hypothetical protein [Candidatus Saccharimonadales bacterium]